MTTGDDFEEFRTLAKELRTRRTNREGETEVITSKAADAIEKLLEHIAKREEGYKTMINERWPGVKRHLAKPDSE